MAVHLYVVRVQRPSCSADFFVETVGILMIYLYLEESFFSFFYLMWVHNFWLSLSPERGSFQDSSWSQQTTILITVVIWWVWNETVCYEWFESSMPHCNITVESNNHRNIMIWWVNVESLTTNFKRTVNVTVEVNHFWSR